MTEPPSVDVVHRLKNHLAIILGFTELLLGDCAANDRRRADLLEVDKAARDALALMPEIGRRVNGGAGEA